MFNYLANRLLTNKLLINFQYRDKLWQKSLATAHCSADCARYLRLFGNVGKCQVHFEATASSVNQCSSQQLIVEVANKSDEREWEINHHDILWNHILQWQASVELRRARSEVKVSRVTTRRRQTCSVDRGRRWPRTLPWWRLWQESGVRAGWRGRGTVQGSPPRAPLAPTSARTSDNATPPASVASVPPLKWQ